MSHAGGGPGFATQMRIYPEENLGVVMMDNDTSFPMYTSEVRPQKGLRGLAERHPLVLFFFLAYAFSWLLTLPLLVGNNGLGLLDYTLPRSTAQLLIIFSLYGPFASAVIMASLTGQGVRQLLSGYLKLAVNPAWYLVSLLGPLLFLTAGILAVAGLGAASVFAGNTGGAVSAFFILLVMLFFIGGPLGEEAGWRGFALPRMQARYGALAASLILGVLWVGWHLPNFFIPEMGTWQGSKLIYLFLGLALSILHTWVFNGTGGSLFLVTLLHAAVDASSRLLLPAVFETDRAGGNLAVLLAYAVWAGLVILITRGKLAYRPPVKPGV